MSQNASPVLGSCNVRTGPLAWSGRTLQACECLAWIRGEKEEMLSSSIRVRVRELSSFTKTGNFYLCCREYGDIEKV